MDILVYVDKITPRLKYVFNHVFITSFGFKIKYTTDLDYFQNSTIYKINYSKKKFRDELFFFASDILFETDIHEQNVTVSTYNGKKVLFICKKSSLPFDVFAAIFYLLTRYEEYLPHKKDKIGRYLHTESIAYKNNFLHQPIIEYWLGFLKDILIIYFPKIHFKNHVFKFHNTIDIDNAFAFLEKSVPRQIISTIKDLFYFDYKNIILRLKVLFFNKKDPYDTYETILAIHEKFKLNTSIFFLLATYGVKDRGVNSHSDKLRLIIRKIAEKCTVGLHSSFNSIKNPHSLYQETHKINDILRIQVKYNRQHYLKLNIPFVYRNLIKSNITHDYSMGYPACVGFRAGTSRSFVFFDLYANDITNLDIHPFSIMDTTLNDYMTLSPQNALSLIKGHIDVLRLVNGTLTTVWHNESLSYISRWKRWDSVYIDMIKYINDGKD
jgi:hypothetical protein